MEQYKFNEIIELKRQRQYDECVTRYLAAINVGDKDSNIFGGLGKIYFLQGEYSKACNAYLAEIHLTLNYYNKAFSEINSGNYSFVPFSTQLLLAKAVEDVSMKMFIASRGLPFCAIMLSSCSNTLKHYYMAVAMAKKDSDEQWKFDFNGVYSIVDSYRSAIGSGEGSEFHSWFQQNADRIIDIAICHVTEPNVLKFASIESDDILNLYPSLSSFKNSASDSLSENNSSTELANFYEVMQNFSDKLNVAFEVKQESINGTEYYTLNTYNYLDYGDMKILFEPQEIVNIATQNINRLVESRFARTKIILASCALYNSIEPPLVRYNNEDFNETAIEIKMPFADDTILFMVSDILKDTDTKAKIMQTIKKMVKLNEGQHVQPASNIIIGPFANSAKEIDTNNINDDIILNAMTSTNDNTEFRGDDTIKKDITVALQPSQSSIITTSNKSVATCFPPFLKLLVKIVLAPFALIAVVIGFAVFLALIIAIAVIAAVGLLPIYMLSFGSFDYGHAMESIGTWLGSDDGLGKIIAVFDKIEDFYRYW